MKNKFGFSVVELVVTLSIMGILIVVSLYTINHNFTDFFTRYYAAYDSLNKVAYNTYTDTYCRLGDCTVEQKKAGRKFPTDAENLCKRFTEYFNTTNSNCSNNVIQAASNSEFNDKNDKYLQFSTTNGFKFYISRLNNGNSEPIKDDDNYKVSYFIVYIDLNGKSVPNKIDHEVHPDIVPFIVTTTGDVIPVGHPIYDKTYATARVINYEGKETKSYTLNEARGIAFGEKAFRDMPLTLMEKFNNLLPNNAKDKSTNPHTTPPLGTELGCEEGTFNCSVKIDANMEKRY